MKVIVNRSKLEGEITVFGAKNSALRIVVASLLSKEKIILTNIPVSILDMQVQLKMLEFLGKDIQIDNDTVIIAEKQSLKTDLIWDERSIRNTLLVLGCLLARKNKGRVPLPGGCQLGDRKYDIHVYIMEKMGAQVWEENGYLCAESKDRLRACDLYLPIRSTGATENGILMGCLAQGKTTVWNPHIRPEIIDLIDFLKKMGACIKVNGQESIEIEGIEELNTPAVHRCIPDNMEALTFAIAAAITGGELEIHDFPFKDLEIPMIHLRESGMKYYQSNDNKSLIVKRGHIYPIEIATGPYPAINSDMQPLFAAYGLFAQGKSKIVDLRFTGRYAYSEEFKKLGAQTCIDNDFLVIEGGNVGLQGTETTALDLRAGAALVLVGLNINGTTTVDNFEQVLRGYDRFIEKFQSVNAKIELIL
jgi:UDP-N-acetylglucosamine 1-carboxyvinyltransferase